MKRSAASKQTRLVTEVSNLGGLEGKAIIHNKIFPTNDEVLAAIPAHLKKKSTPTSLFYAFSSLLLTVFCVYLGRTLIPYTIWAFPLWIVYGLITGTVATGVWVVAHECGHNAFSDNKTLQDAVGYIFHTALLVPYFSWQRSHAVHHSRTNHMEEGETHVPTPFDCPKGAAALESRTYWDEEAFGVINTIQHLIFGWPAYLLSGVTGGPVRGTTSHFTGSSSGKVELFPSRDMKMKVLMSDIGIVAVLLLLFKWYTVEGFYAVFVTYILPYLGTNAWLVGITWLQHTDVDIPHYDSENWTWAKGALLTVDRPYPAIIDWLHHRIGTTHVAHHICSAIPHYNAKEATEAIKKAFPDHYLYDPTPIHLAMWRVARKCIVVRKEGDMWVYTDGNNAVLLPFETPKN